MLGATNPKFANVIARFVGRLGEKLEAMDAAYSNRDMEALAKLAHWLKGASGTVGFDVLNMPAAELEAAAKAADLAVIEQHFHHLHLLATRIAHGAWGTTEPVAVGVPSACKFVGSGPG